MSVVDTLGVQFDQHYLDMFWALIDEILNATLFVLIGMEILLVLLSLTELVAVFVAMAVTLSARLLTGGIPVRLLPRVFRLPRGSWKEFYGVVVFSILVQGLSIGKLTRQVVPDH